MMDKLLEILVGQLPEAIYFALFLLFTKNLKEKKLLFVLILCVEYILSFQTIRFLLWSHIMFFILAYTTLKLLYKEKAQITDVFTLAIASIILIINSMVLYFPVLFFCKKYIIYVIIGRISMFVILFLLKNKLPKIQKLYKKFWNRNDDIPKPMKSATFRALNTVCFNFMFFILNLRYDSSFGIIWEVKIMEGGPWHSWFWMFDVEEGE